MPELNPNSEYEYAISVGEGTLYAYGITEFDRIGEILCDALEYHGTAAVVTAVVTPDCCTGEYTRVQRYQVCL